MIVSDTNLLVHFWLHGTEYDLASKIREKETEWIAPSLWKSEFRNTLSLYLRKNIITFEEMITIMNSVENMMRGRSIDTDSLNILDLINMSSCSAYDCEFVALAKELEIPLLTFDKKVLKEFPKIAIHPNDFIS